MRSFYLINGYGVPKDIFKDDSYRTYLNQIFNVIYDASVFHQVEPVIIFSGGKTDMFKPYRRTEAGEMAKYFKFLAGRPFVKAVTKTWKYELEDRALSSLENILFARELLTKKYPKVKTGTIIFEATRTKRIQTVAKKVLKKFSSLKFLPLEFDVSVARYDHALVTKKETYALEIDLWSLKSAHNLKVHHEIFVEKIHTLRQAGPLHHQEAVQDWWRQTLLKLELI